MTTPNWILWMSAHFSPEQYLFWTRLQSVFWTLADLLIVFFLIRLSNQARSITGGRPHRYSYALLFGTTVLVPFLAVAPSGGLLFLVDVGITVPHFLLLCYLLTVNIRVYAQFVGAMIEGDADSERQ